MKAIILVLVFLFSVSAFATEWSTQALEDAASPLTTDARAVFWTGTGATTLFWMLKKPITAPIRNHIGATKPLGNWSKLGNYSGLLIPNALYVIGMGIQGRINNNGESISRANTMLMASVYSFLVANALVYMVQENRPDTPDQTDSFPSMHAANIFTFASVIGMEHDWPYAVPAYMLAAFVGFSRINDDRHFLHDVVAGATLGASYGIGVATRHHGRTRSHGHESNSSIMLIPTGTLDGAVFSYQFWM